MLKPKVQFKSIDKAGGIIKVADITGAYSVDNPEGWGFPNTSSGDISRVILTLSQYNIQPVYRQTYVRVADPLHPEWLIIPTINQIIAGKEMSISAITIGGSPAVLPFEDGVYDLNMYDVISTPKLSIVATTGATYVLGTGLDAYLQYDSILIGESLYDIDKTKTTNGGTVLYLVQEILADGTSFYPCFRANTKFLNSVATDSCSIKKAGKLASCGVDSKLKSALLDVQVYQWAAKYAFDAGDYLQANILTRAAQRTCNAYNCGC